MNVLRKPVLLLIVVVGVTAIGSLFVGRVGLHRLKLKSCFDNVQGLRSGAAVRLAGVEIGTVGRVRPNPENKSCPAEIEMQLATTYVLQVPSDSVAEIDTAGLLGPTFVNIDASGASGAAALNYSYVRGKPSQPPMTAQDIANAARALIRPCENSKAADRNQEGRLEETKKRKEQ